VKILYELTYMFRGNSGVPKDTLHQAQILEEHFPESFEMVVNPSSYLSISKFRVDNRLGISKNVPRVFRMFPRAGFARRNLGNAFVIASTVLNFLPRNLITLNPKFHSLYPEPVKKLTKDSSHSLYMIPLNFKARYLMNVIGIPPRVRTKGIDVFIQQSLLPVRVSKGTTHIIRLHDLISITHPEFFTTSSAFIYRRSIAMAVREKGIVWAVPTQAIASQFNEMYGDNLQTHVVSNTIVVKYKGDFRAKEKIVLVLSTLEPRKNIDLAIDGFLHAQQSGSIGGEWRMIVAGGYGWKAQKLYDDLRNGAYGPNVVFHESPDDLGVSELFTRSSIIACTSSHEGFSRPPLEGMSYGCLPVISDIPQHRETMGELGYFIEGEGIEAIAKAMTRAVEVSESDCKDLRNQLREHVVSNFSSAVVGQQWKKVFDDISLANKRP